MISSTATATATSTATSTSTSTSTATPTSTATSTSFRLTLHRHLLDTALYSSRRRHIGARLPYLGAAAQSSPAPALAALDTTYLSFVFLPFITHARACATSFYLLWSHLRSSALLIVWLPPRFPLCAHRRSCRSPLSSLARLRHSVSAVAQHASAALSRRKRIILEPTARGHIARFAGPPARSSGSLPALHPQDVPRTAQASTSSLR